MKPKKCIENINAYCTPLFGECGFLKLDSNESDFGCSPKVLETLRNIDASDLQYYPYYGEFLEKLAKFHGIEIENLITTAGADESINAIFSTFLEAGQTILTVKPSFVMPKLYAQINKLNYVEVPYVKKWEFPIEEFLEKIDEADLIHLTTPNSPTGETISRENIEKIIEKSGNKAVLIDETYMNYAKSSSLDFLRHCEECCDEAIFPHNVFVVRSFSKDFGLAGLRLGYVVSHPENIISLRKHLSPYNVSTLTVKAGISALEDFAFFENVKKEMEVSKSILKQGLEVIGAKVYPSETNFLLVDFGLKAEFIYKKLLDNKIKVKYFAQKGASAEFLENTMRIGVPKLENTQKILKALEVKPTIVFDMDGVLIDTSKSYRLAVKKTVEEFTGKAISFEQIQEAKNLGGLNNDWDLTEFLIRKNIEPTRYCQEGTDCFTNTRNDAPTRQSIIEIFQQLYWDNGNGLINDEDCLVNENFIKDLAKNYNLAIFTGRPRTEAIYTLEKNNIKDYFYPIITMDDLPLDKQKPSPLGLEVIKEKIITDKIYYLGDTQDDMKCAKSAQVVGVGVLPPQDKSDDLRNRLNLEQPMVILEKAMDLKEFLNENS